jgi:TolA-binding protein
LKTLAQIAVVLIFTFWLFFEHQARHEQGQEITALRQQLNQMTEVVVENGGMSNLVTQARQLQIQNEDQARDLVQLRYDMRVLRQQTNEIEALRGEVFQVRTGIEGGAKAQNLGQKATVDKEAGLNSSRLEVLEAYYWTQNKAIDVTKELKKRILDDKLEVIARNDISSDPEFGQVKTLTVIYRFDGVTMTNEVREGELLVLPEK